MIKTSYEITNLMLRSIISSKREILNFLEHKEIVGKNPQGEVTRYFDKAIELTLIRKLRDSGFYGTIIGEETGIHEGATKSYVYIDPLDGSLNAASGINYYCVALAYLESNRLDDIKAAVVWDIPNDVVYFAERNRGTFKWIGEKISKLVVNGQYDVLVIDVGFTTCEKCLKKIKEVGTFRRLGSIIMSSILVVEGVLDGVFDVGNLKATDALAPYLIVREAGGFSFINRDIFGGNERVHLVVARSRDLFDYLMKIYNTYVGKEKE